MAKAVTTKYMRGWQDGWHEYATDRITIDDDVSYIVHRDVMIQSFSAWMILRGKSGNVVIDPSVPYCTSWVVLDLLNDVYSINNSQQNGNDDDSSMMVVVEHVLGKACLAEYLGANSWLRKRVTYDAEVKAKEHFERVANTCFERSTDFYRDLGYLEVLTNLLLSTEHQKDIEEWKVMLWVRLANSSAEIIKESQIRDDDMAISLEKLHIIEVFSSNCLEILSRPFGELFGFKTGGTTAVLVNSNLRHELQIEKSAQNNIVCHTIDNKGEIRHFWGLGNALRELYNLHVPDHKPQTEKQVHDPSISWFWWIDFEYPPKYL